MSYASVYRFFNDAGDLLYVGVTNDQWRRFAEHAEGKPWWPEVDHYEIEMFADRSLAEDAESVAIWQEHPRYNVSNPIVKSRVDIGRTPRALDTVSIEASILGILEWMEESWYEAHPEDRSQVPR